MGKLYPVRKQYRLKNYDYASPSPYFITVCVAERKCVLSTIEKSTDIDKPSQNSVGAANGSPYGRKNNKPI